MRARGWGAAWVAVLGLGGCARESACPRCDTIVIAAIGEPRSLLPPLVVETVGRDISDQVFERLADLGPGAAPIDSTAYRPGLASRWERVDSLTWRFQLRPGARWHDGRPVTPEDVQFSFEAFSDAGLDAPARTYLAGEIRVEPEGTDRVLVRFRRAYPEQLYDATYHVRVIPAHVWRSVPRAAWAADTSLSRLVGSGPYRVAAWDRGASLTLVADSSRTPRARIGRAIWRFAEDPDAALNMILAHEADLLEVVGPPDRVARVEGDPAFRTIRYPSAAYGFLGFNVAARRARGQTERRAPHPLFGDREVRRALTMAVDRAAVARAVFGSDAKVPPGPMSQLLWIWDDHIAVLPYDTAQASRTLDRAGWVRGREGIRQKGGLALAFDILVPATSGARRRIAEMLQETWRTLGARVTVTAVDFPVFQERLGQGRFDTYLGAWLDEPSPRGLADQWTADGIGAINYGRYVNPVFDSLFRRAAQLGAVGPARAAWREALDTLNADAPAIFLYAPTNVAAASRRIEGLEVNPYSWLSGLPAWRLVR